MIPLRKFSILKRIALVFIFLILFIVSSKGQGFIPLTHVSAFYMNAECGGRMKIKFMYMDRGISPKSDLNYITFYYKNSSNNFIPFAEMVRDHSKTHHWTESWYGATRNYSIGSVGTASITFGNKNNPSSTTSYIDFILNTGSVAVFNGFITVP